MTNLFHTIDGETLMRQPLKPIQFVVDGLLSQGLHLLVGAPTSEKSWLALLVAVSALHIGYELAPDPEIRPMSAFIQVDKAIPPAEPNPTPEPSPPQTTVTVTATEPKMGDTRIVDGQKQVYFLGFGWIEDNDEPNIGIVVDGEGDINKMVGTMDGGEVGRSCGDINKAVGTMD